MRTFSVRATAAAQQGPIAPIRHPARGDQKFPEPSPRTRPQTPSEVLLAALKERGYETGIYEPTKGNRVDLSWVSPNKQELVNKRKEFQSKEHAQATPDKHRMAYATIVAHYIRQVEPLVRLKSTSEAFGIQHEDSLDRAILNTFDDDALQYLSSRGYSVEDVVSWAWILTSETAHTAALRYVKVENRKRHGESRIGPPIPPFVLLFIFRRENITAGALGILLPIAAHMLRKAPDYKTSKNLEVMRRMHNDLMQSTAWDTRDNTTAMIIIVRLLRAARNVSPPALLSVADIFTSIFGIAGIVERFGEFKDTARRHITSSYNQCIVLMSEPCRNHPYQSATFQHRAVFQLLREMTKFDPPIFVSRNAYQAIIRIQAIREKSAPEREWEDLKSPSWPPWKQEKLGIDAERGKEGSTSMTIKAMRLMAKSGYAMGQWEKVAGIVGGWDTDGTPTIQTRTILPSPNKTRKGQSPTSSHPTAQMNSHPDIWAARIRATRTLNEAWASFLGYREQWHDYVDKGVYLEMIQKLAYAERLQRYPESARAASNAIPGDGKEVFPEPSSPRDTLYVPSNPPSLHDFVGDMLETRIGLSRRLLVLLLAHVDYDLGTKCLSSSFLSSDELNCLRNIATRPDPNYLWHLRQIPEDVVAAVVNFFGRSFRHRTSDPATWTLAFPIALSSRLRIRSTSDWPAKPERALFHICELMRLRLPRTPRPWNIFLSHLIELRAEHDRRVPAYLQRAVAWIESREVVRWMDQEGVPFDMDTLQILSSILCKVIRAHRQHEVDLEQSLNAAWHGELFGQNIAWALPRETPPEMIRDGLDLIKRRFYQLASHPSSAVASSLPKPLPAQIHAFVRLLGLAGDHDGLLTVLWWISKSERHLRFTVHELTNGPVHMRRAMIAIRVFLEGHIDIWAGTPPQNMPNPEPLSSDTATGESAQRVLRERRVQAARGIFQKLKFLEHWPTDEEVSEYVASSAERDS